MVTAQFSSVKPFDFIESSAGVPVGMTVPLPTGTQSSALPLPMPSPVPSAAEVPLPDAMTLPQLQSGDPVQDLQNKLASCVQQTEVVTEVEPKLAKAIQDQQQAQTLFDSKSGEAKQIQQELESAQNAAMEACGSMNDLTQSGMKKPEDGAQAKKTRSRKQKRTSKKVVALKSADDDDDEEEEAMGQMDMGQMDMGQMDIGQMMGGMSSGVSSQFGDIMQHVMQNSPMVKAKMEECKKRTNLLGDVNKQYNNRMAKVNEYQSNLTEATELVESLKGKYEEAQMLAVQSCPMLNGADAHKIKVQLRKLTAKVVKAAQLPVPTATALPAVPTSTAPAFPAAAAPTDPTGAVMPADPAAMQAKMAQCKTNTDAVTKVTNQLAEAQRKQQNRQGHLDSKSQEVQTVQAQIEAAQNAATEACAAIGGAAAKTAAKKAWDKTMKATQLGVEAPVMAAPSAVSPVAGAPAVDTAAMQAKVKDCTVKTRALNQLQSNLQAKQGYQAQYESAVQQATAELAALEKQQADAQELASTSCQMDGPMRAKTGLAKLRLSATRRR